MYLLTIQLLIEINFDYVKKKKKLVQFNLDKFAHSLHEFL